MKVQTIYKNKIEDDFDFNQEPDNGEFNILADIYNKNKLNKLNENNEENTKTEDDKDYSINIDKFLDNKNEEKNRRRHGKGKHS